MKDSFWYHYKQKQAGTAVQGFGSTALGVVKCLWLGA